MRNLVVAVLIGLALGFGLGYLLLERKAGAAEERAKRAQALYDARVAQDKREARDRIVFDSVRAEETAAADSAQQAADSAVAAVTARAAATTARARAALALAATIRDTADTYRGLYEEAAGQRDDALALVEDQRRVAGRLRAMLAADTVELGRERRRTADWKRTADSLAVANADLLEHRRSGFDLKLGLGGFLAGAATATGVCLVSKRCGSK